MSVSHKANFLHITRRRAEASQEGPHQPLSHRSACFCPSLSLYQTIHLFVYSCLAFQHSLRLSVRLRDRKTHIFTPSFSHAAHTTCTNLTVDVGKLSGSRQTPTLETFRCVHPKRLRQKRPRGRLRMYESHLLFCGSFDLRPVRSCSTFSRRQDFSGK